MARSIVPLGHKVSSLRFPHHLGQLTTVALYLALIAAPSANAWGDSVKDWSHFRFRGGVVEGRNGSLMYVSPATWSFLTLGTRGEDPHSSVPIIDRHSGQLINQKLAVHDGGRHSVAGIQQLEELREKTDAPVVHRVGIIDPRSVRVVRQGGTARVVVDPAAARKMRGNLALGRQQGEFHLLDQPTIWTSDAAGGVQLHVLHRNLLASGLLADQRRKHEYLEAMDEHSGVAAPTGRELPYYTVPTFPSSLGPAELWQLLQNALSMFDPDTAHWNRHQPPREGSETVVVSYRDNAGATHDLPIKLVFDENVQDIVRDSELSGANGRLVTAFPDIKRLPVVPLLNRFLSTATAEDRQFALSEVATYACLLNNWNTVVRLAQRGSPNARWPLGEDLLLRARGDVSRSLYQLLRTTEQVTNSGWFAARPLRSQMNKLLAKVQEHGTDSPTRASYLDIGERAGRIMWQYGLSKAAPPNASALLSAIVAAVDSSLIVKSGREILAAPIRARPN